MTSTRFDPGVILAGWGERYGLMSNMYKPYACGLVVHAAIDGCIELKREHAIQPADVERIELRVSPLALELTGRKTPRTGLEGKFSVYHAAAAAFLHGTAGEPQFSDDCVRDPAVVALRDRVSAQAGTSIRKTEAYVTIALKDGRTLLPACRARSRHVAAANERCRSGSEVQDPRRRHSHPWTNRGGHHLMLATDCAGGCRRAGARRGAAGVSALLVIRVSRKGWMP